MSTAGTCPSCDGKGSRCELCEECVDMSTEKCVCESCDGRGFVYGIIDDPDDEES